MISLNEMIASRLGKKVESLSFTGCIGIGLMVRIALVLYSAFHDGFFNHIKYTDIDYQVISNGSSALINRSSPYTDLEYRYSPLLAFLFIPNVLLFECFSKVTLILTDCLCAKLLHLINLQQGVSDLHSKAYITFFWLLNPLPLAISTRGSFEPIIGSLILATIYAFSRNKLFSAGTLLGLTIHLKIYPIIYLPIFYLYLSEWTSKKTDGHNMIVKLFYTLLPNLNRVYFVSSTVLSFSLVTCGCYFIYGYTYLYQSFIYHFSRIDLQHNFSIYFYLFRLYPNYIDHICHAAFIPQIGLIILFTVLYYTYNSEDKKVRLSRMTFSLFCETFAFVAFNKVCTSQYFIWYALFLPLIGDNIYLNLNQVTTLFSIWILSQAQWLFPAYLYEYQELPVLDLVGLASFIFLLTNLLILYYLCVNNRFINSSLKKKH